MTPAAPTALVLGGARSGKSAYAEALAEAAGPERVYLATAEALDDEMRARIDQHRARRGPGWTTLESPIDIAAHVGAADPRPLLVDCLTLWLSNLLHAGEDVSAHTSALLHALGRRPTVLVSNEVGLSITPENALARRFRDAQGVLNQQAAAAADHVAFVAAGLPLALKGAAPWS